MNSRNVLLALSLGLVCWRGLPQEPAKPQDPPAKAPAAEALENLTKRRSDL